MMLIYLKNPQLVEDDLDQESVGEAMLNVVRLSSASLASSSSSGSSSEPRPKTATPTPGNTINWFIWTCSLIFIAR